jgi:MoaA/NifB/PqqE/SkfB family radical SAM enzyme
LSGFLSRKKKEISTINWLENKYQKLIFKYLSTFKTPIPCQALSASLFINPSGDIYPCSMWDIMIANLKDINYNLVGLWHEQKVLKAWQLIKSKKCSNCWTPCEAYQSILAALLDTTCYST